MSDDDTANTALYDNMHWLPPVATADLLPPDAREGQLCYVQDEEHIYEFHDGHWGEPVDR